MPEVDKNNIPVLTEEWLNNRFFLFEKYCLPSIMNQSCKNFVWIVLFSSNTPEKYLSRIQNYESIFPLFKPIFIEKGDHDSVKNELNDIINHFLHQGDEYIITSRIDNDDSLDRDFVLEVQKLFDKQENMFQSFIYGFQYDIKRKVIGRMHYANNHFISRYEKISKNFNTVITHEHTAIKDIAEVIYVKNKQNPMWLEIIHEGNAINFLQPSSLPLFNSSIIKSFGILENEISIINTLGAYYRYLRLNILIFRASILKRLGIYNLIKGYISKN